MNYTLGSLASLSRAAAALDVRSRDLRTAIERDEIQCGAFAERPSVGTRFNPALACPAEMLEHRHPGRTETARHDQRGDPRGRPAIGAQYQHPAAGVQMRIQHRER